jgi:hypothetical protein
MKIPGYDPEYLRGLAEKGEGIGTPTKGQKVGEGYKISEQAKNALDKIDSIKTQKGLVDFVKKEYGVDEKKKILKGNFENGKSFIKGVVQVFEEFPGVAGNVGRIEYGPGKGLANFSFTDGKTKGDIGLTPKGKLNIDSIAGFQSAGIHEALHAVDYRMTIANQGVYDTLASKNMIDETLKNMGLRVNSKTAIDLQSWFFGVESIKEVSKPYEVFTWSLSSEMTGGGNAFSEALLQILKGQYR